MIDNEKERRGRHNAKEGERSGRQEKVHAPGSTFLDLLANRPPEVQAIANRLREIVYEVLPKAEQAIYPNWKLALYRDVEAICAIQPAKEHASST